jgi:ATP-dependent DNA helicase RecG
MAFPINIGELLHGNTVEWDRIELKKGWNPEDVLHSLCAFANDINNWDGGYIIIGVEEEKGQAKLPPAGLLVPELDGIQKKLIELSYKLSPSYFPVSQPYILDGAHILVVFAPAGDNRPYKAPISLSEKRTDRAMYIKRGSKTIKVRDGSDEERRLIELTARIPFDDRINSVAKIDDLSLQLIQAYLKEVGSDLYEESTKIPFPELCRHMMIAKGSNEFFRPTNAGILLFCINPERFFSGSRIELVIHKGEVGKDYIEKIFSGSIIQQIREVLQFFQTNIVEELVVKPTQQAESLRFYNYPFQAIEEAVVNAVFHKSYERENPVEIQILRDRIEILSFPGPMPPINKEMLKMRRVVVRDYRNRKIGGYLKELKLTEGGGTGLPIIHKSLEENGSPPAIFETDENNAYFLCIIPIHPLASEVSIKRTKDRTKVKFQEINSLSEVDSYLRLLESQRWKEVESAIKAYLSEPVLILLRYCIQPKSREEIFHHIGLFNNSKNFNKHLKPLLNMGWIKFVLPDRPTSKNQKYLTADFVHKLLENSDSMRVPITSSNLSSVKYDWDKQLLEIAFHYGAVFQYFDVPQTVYEELMNSPSKDSYFINEIKSKFECREM